MREGLLQPPASAADAPTESGFEESDVSPDMMDSPLVQGEASPEEQELYNRIMDAALVLIHEDAMSEKITSAFSKVGPESLARTIGEMALTVYTVIEAKLSEQGIQVPDAVRMEAGEDIIFEFVQVAVAMKLIDESDESLERVTVEAIQTAFAGYGDQLKEQGRVSAEDLAVNTQRLDQAMATRPKPLAEAVAAQSDQY